MLVGLVGAPLHLSIGLQPLGRQKQPLGARPGDRIGVAPAMLLELALALPQPALTPLHAGHDLGRIKLERHLLGSLRLPHPRCLRLRLLGFDTIAGRPLPGPAKELAPALRRAQPLGQLIAARLAVELVLGLVGRPGLGHDLAGDLVRTCS